jgi:hypothetical protein
VSSKNSKAKNKAPVKNEGESSENENEVKPPSRQSKRNMNKVITYRDEDLSEDEAYPKRGGKNVKKAKNGNSHVSDDNEDHPGGEFKAKAKNPSVSKKKSRTNDIEDEQDTDGSLSEEESKTKKSKPKEKKDVPPPVKKSKIDKPPLNKIQSDYESLDFSSDGTTSDGKLWNLKISSWNIGGLKAWVKVRFCRLFLIGITYVLVKQMDQSGEETIRKLETIRCTFLEDV